MSPAPPGAVAAPAPSPALARCGKGAAATAKTAATVNGEVNAGIGAVVGVNVQHSLSPAEDPARKEAQCIIEWLEAREGSSLRAWLRHFDQNNDQKISLNEFVRGMKRLNYTGDITTAFTYLDSDASGELSLDELDAAQASLWRHFRAWCVASFGGPTDMLKQIAGSADTVWENIDECHFRDGLRWLGWSDGCEDLLFRSLDANELGFITEDNLRWLEVEKRRQRRKEQAKLKATSQQDTKRSKEKERRIADAVLSDFKRFLRRRYGHFVRAWRRVLSPDGSMVLQKNDLFKAVASIGWLGDVRLLWQAFDKDDSGTVSIEELDVHGAEILAHFHKFVKDQFGSASSAFRQLDKFNTRKLRQPEFAAAVKSHGFRHPAKSLFHGLDLQGNRTIVEEDLLFLDRWKPPAFLVAMPNFQAAEDMKQTLLKTCKNYLKAWRHVLDLDSSNRCNWEEFEIACRKVGFTGDIAGAWRALDQDLSGFITLHEIDAVACETLSFFKRWAEEEFGSVRSAFGVFDSDGSNEVSYREFRRACRAYGLDRDVHTLFYALDTERNGVLSLEEVIFLDEWEFNQDSGNCESEVSSIGALPQVGFVPSCELATYSTEGPGPAFYAVPTTIGAGPTAPMLRFSGAFSFRRRTHGYRLSHLERPDSSGPAPTSYDGHPGHALIAPAKPVWSFGSEPRKVVEARASGSGKPSPGPGHYDRHFVEGRISTGPAFTCSPRRPLRVHPLLRGEGLPSLKVPHAPHTAR